MLSTSVLISLEKLLFTKTKKMKRLISALSLISTVTMFTSCQKEDSNPTPVDINGTWAFVSIEADTKAANEFNDGTGNQKTVTTSNYITENNTGIVTINASTMSTSDFSYSVNTTSKSDYYLNGVLQNTFNMPFNFDCPVSNSTSTYKTIGADSIYFDSGNIFMNGASQQTVPCGAKLSREGNLLYMNITSSEISTQVVSGATVKIEANVTAKVKLQRQ